MPSVTSTSAPSGSRIAPTGRCVSPSSRDCWAARISPSVTLRPRRRSSSRRRRARSSGDAVRKTFNSAPGNTSDPWSRPSVTTSMPSAMRRCMRFIASRTAGASATGRVAWRTPRSGEMAGNPQLKKSYATPAIVTLDGREQLLSQGADWLYAYDPGTGRELWKIRYGQLGFSLSARAVFGGGMAYLSTGFMKPEIQAIQLDAKPEPVHRWKYSKGAPTMPSPLLIGAAAAHTGRVTTKDRVMASGRSPRTSRWGRLANKEDGDSETTDTGIPPAITGG